MLRKVTSRFAEIHGGDHPIINQNAPELLFLNKICEAKTEDAVAIFTDSLLFGGPSVVDAPHGRFEGKEEIKSFADDWLKSFSATIGSIEPVIQTKSCGRSVTELVFHYEKDGKKKHIPMAAAADLRPEGKMDGLRLYFHYKWAPGFNAYRAPIFKSSHMAPSGYSLLTGAVREYFEALHTEPGVDVERLMNAVGKRCAFGGYSLEEVVLKRDKLSAIYERLSTYIPRWLQIRVETIIDDGVNCVVEWQHIITKEGREEGGRICQSGISAYERGTDGKLCGIRICDNANCESEIDWATARNPKDLAMRINYLG